MVGNIVFSLNMIAPIFLLVLLGYILKLKSVITKEYEEISMKIVFNLALPFLMFNSIYGSDFILIYNSKFVAFTVLYFVLLICLGLALCKIFIKDKNHSAVITQGIYRVNSVILGVPLILNILGNDGLTVLAMLTTFISPIINITSVLLFVFYDEKVDLKKINVKEILIAIIKNPFIIATIAAVPFMIFNVGLPVMVTKTIEYVAQLATPLALIIMGSNLKVKAFSANIGKVAFVTFMRLIISPLLAIFLAVKFFNFNNNEIVCISIILASPTAISSYIISSSMGFDEDLSAGIVLTTTLLSIVTIFLLILYFKTYNFI